jgi:hydrogenase nickel incorporation protein HypA/HybF
MHELSIAKSVIQIIENSVESDFNKKITKVHLNIGKLSGIEIDALTFSFSIIKKNTILENAEMEINQINGMAKCRKCGINFELNSFGNPCPKCNDYAIDILQGKEMKVTQISIEDEQ